MSDARTRAIAAARHTVGRGMTAAGISPQSKAALLDAGRRVRDVRAQSPDDVGRAVLAELRAEFPASRPLRAAETLVRPTNPNRIAALIDRRRPEARAALRERIGQVIGALTGDRPAPDTDTTTLLARLETAVVDGAPDSYWLALAVLGAALPDSDAVIRAARVGQADGPLTALAEPLTARLKMPTTPTRVEIVTDQVLVDMHHTAQTDLATGIQRVARLSAQRWVRDHGVRLVGWTGQQTALRPLTPAEAERALHGGASDVNGESIGAPAVIVPWRATYVLPELVTERIRTDRIQALFRFSGSRTGVIGFDCVPITTAETVAPGMGAAFATTMAAVAHCDRVATISQSAASEYRGWRTMLGGVGIAGPDIAPVVLPVEAPEADPGQMAQARNQLPAAPVPVVLCVGSHEPRKNHLALLHAAELLWREGVQFALVFVGGNSWRNDGFTERLAALVEEDRPISTFRALDDARLWAAYRIARCTVFPSLNEGFGLPVAESLASGTPVITSGFGSMAEIAAQGGALLIDPRDDNTLLDALRTMLTDDAMHARLTAEAKARPIRTWDAYAGELWDYLVRGE